MESLCKGSLTSLPNIACLMRHQSRRVAEFIRAKLETFHHRHHRSSQNSQNSQEIPEIPENLRVQGISDLHIDQGEMGVMGGNGWENTNLQFPRSHLRQSDKKSIAAQAEPWTSRTSHFIIPSNQACRSKIHRSSSSTHHLIETALERQKPATSKGYVNTMYCIVLYTTLTWTTYTKHLHNMGKCKCRWATDDITTTNQPTACPKIVVINM
ncbi:hypothetical protein F5Y02DRAFT_316269 [Annulohypoxylon stygium]|nr:hypothetical protein F5Y02DRAFT_316269 [Annulohypoxylon stygium]